MPPPKRKPSASPVPHARKTATENSTKPVVDAPVNREYQELMEMVDHAVNLGDWTSTGYILGQQTQWQLSEEQRHLLYRDSGMAVTNVDVQAFPRLGWGERNVVSARTAWAAVRYPIFSRQGVPQNGASVESNGPQPTVASSWLQEDSAEQDAALAALSEGTQLYLKNVLEKAVHCARQRQNVSGIRLWHQQMSSKTPPPLQLQLGCDVTRQVARALGNAALTCKRMEEALERQTHVPAKDRTLNDVTMNASINMSELALRPKLANGAQEADSEAKRNFETFGGKDANEPPLGRLNKAARIELIDLQLGSRLQRPGHHRAAPFSAAFSF